VVWLVTLPVAMWQTGEEGLGQVGGAAIGLVWFVYRAATDATGGSLGKRLLRLRVVGAAGPAPGLGAGATRNLWGLSSLLPVLLPWTLVGNALAVAASVSVAVTIARDPQDRGWHDRLAGTAVRRPT
jgi:uncharacterized RDD family membrane protein YckC